MSDAEKNLKLWNQVEETNPKFTRVSEKNNRTFTSIAPMYQFKRATELFGPEGIGWGVLPDSESFTESTYGNVTILTYDAVLFYDYPFELKGLVREVGVGKIPIHASQRIAYMTRQNYMKVDEEARKKVVTDAKTKGLSELGIGADVFLGMFEDPNYIDFRNYEESLLSAEKAGQKREESLKEFEVWFADEINCLLYASTKQSITSIADRMRGMIPGKCHLLNIDLTPYIEQVMAAEKNALATLGGAQDGK